MSDKSKNKTVSILFRVSPNELKDIRAKAKKSGLSVSEFIRKSVKGEKITEAPPADFYTLLWEIKRIGNNLNQLLRKLNALGIVYELDLERCEEDIDRMRKLIVQTYCPGKGESDGSNINMGSINSCRESD
jgi:hypothetical protein